MGFFWVEDVGEVLFQRGREGVRIGFHEVGVTVEFGVLVSVLVVSALVNATCSHRTNQIFLSMIILNLIILIFSRTLHCRITLIPYFTRLSFLHFFHFLLPSHHRVIRDVLSSVWVVLLLLFQEFL